VTAWTLGRSGPQRNTPEREPETWQARTVN
jgi:hypothetical protein